VTPPPREHWSQRTRDRAFHVALVASLVAVAWLFWPFMTSLLFAGVTVVVVWPVYERVLARVGGRRALAAFLVLLCVVVLVVGPAALLLWVAATQAVLTWEQALADLQAGRLDAWSVELSAFLHDLPPWAQRLLPPGEGLVDAVTGPAREALVRLLQLGGDLLPRALKLTLGVGLQSLVFVFAVVVLFLEGPRVVGVARTLLPIEDSYVDRLLGVFSRFARNVIVGSLVTAALQGLVGSVGYAIAGVERVAFCGMLTAVCAFVPLIGTSVVWLPVALSLGIADGEWGWAAFLAIWSVALTGGVDNVVKPLLVRGDTDIHPLLIFLAVFGGLNWMGLPGLFVGPVLVAVFLALYHIFVTDFGEAGPALPAPPAPAAPFSAPPTPDPP
jgi:predicted PurR-regulated permease PerM